VIFSDDFAKIETSNSPPTLLLHCSLNNVTIFVIAIVKLNNPHIDCFVEFPRNDRLKYAEAEGQETSRDNVISETFHQVVFFYFPLLKRLKCLSFTSNLIIQFFNLSISGFLIFHLENF